MAATDSVRGQVAVPAGITARDLVLLEARLAGRLDQRFDALMAASLRSRAVSSNTSVVQPGNQGSTSVVPESTVAREPEGVGSAAAVYDPEVLPDRPPPAANPTLAYIERMILEEGLYQTAQINFIINQSTLLSSSIPVLAALGEVLTRHPDVRLEIGGYTDSSGSQPYNQRLSEARAEAVMV
jgi:outer membrane protein OmpA-like peptidoglycan-associated protein